MLSPLIFSPCHATLFFFSPHRFARVIIRRAFAAVIFFHQIAIFFISSSIIFA